MVTSLGEGRPWNKFVMARGSAFSFFFLCHSPNNFNLFVFLTNPSAYWGNLSDKTSYEWKTMPNFHPPPPNSIPTLPVRLKKSKASKSACMSTLALIAVSIKLRTCSLVRTLKNSFTRPSLTPKLISSQILSAPWLIDLAASILKHGPLDFMVYFPARFNVQEI